MGEILIHIAIFLLTLISWIWVKNEKKKPCRRVAKLPPGSMGWPCIGETVQLYSQDPNIFFAAKQKRFGEIFKSHVLGCPCVMLASPEAARFVLVSQAHLFKPTYPKSKELLIGQSALFFHQGDRHFRLRKLVQSSLSMEATRNLVPGLDNLAASTLESLASGKLISTFEVLKNYSFEVGILAIFGNLEGGRKEMLKTNYCMVNKGYNSLPTNLPGTPYKKALSARKRLSGILGKIIRERREERVEEKDLLGCLLSSKDEKGEILSETQISDNIIGLLFAAQDTSASLLTWIIKYLHDDPTLLEAVKAEHKAIQASNNVANQPLSWSNTRNMPISRKVVLESLRMASIISFTFREAVVDVEYKGYLIPKGWKVMPLFRNIHHSPQYFTHPHKFNPSRFDVAPKPNSFMPFGSGVHACPGNELAKLEILIMIHHLVTKFRWEIEGSEGGVEYSPFPVPLNGLPAKFWIYFFIYLFIFQIFSFTFVFPPSHPKQEGMADLDSIFRTSNQYNPYLYFYIFISLCYIELTPF